ncbi:MAG: hypothetical protein IMY81_03615 [Chloroflexi bacterium]|nr:hypothetical protein [Chloroflexota bacterium]
MKKVFFILLSLLVAALGVIVPAESVTAGLISSTSSPAPELAQTEEEEALREDILIELNQAKQYTNAPEIIDFLDAIINRVRNLEWVEFSASAADALEAKYAIAKLIEELINELPIASAGATTAVAAVPSANPLYEELVRIRAKIERLIILETPPEELPRPIPEIARPPDMERLIVYSAKFLCGPAFGKEGVQRGSYSTAINVHNPHNGTVILHKKAVIANPEDDPRGKISPFRRVKLGPDEAIEIDCIDIVDLLGSQRTPTRLTAPSLEIDTPAQEEEPEPTTATLDTSAIRPVTSLIGFIKGFVVIYSTAPLDVVAVYTASTPVGFSLDVEYLSPSTVTTLRVPPPTTESECPPACLCLTKEEAVERGYTEWCEGEIKVCGYDEQQRERYCFSRPTEGECPDGCICLSPEKAREFGYPLCPGETKICGYDAQQNPVYCYQVVTEEECPQGCICKTEVEAKRLGLSLCQGERIECGLDSAGNVLYCYERSSEEQECPQDCLCLTEAQAREKGYNWCQNQKIECGQDPTTGVTKYCFEKPTEVVECPDGCYCLTQAEAKRLGYTLCGGKEIFCGYDASGVAMYCYEKPTGEEECPYGCYCLTEAEAKRLGYTLCGGQKILCGYDAQQNPLYCYEEETGEECPYGCVCLTDVEAKRLGYVLCQGERIACGYIPGGPSRWCYQSPD